MPVIVCIYALPISYLLAPEWRGMKNIIVGRVVQAFFKLGQYCLHNTPQIQTLGDFKARKIGRMLFRQDPNFKRKPCGKRRYSDKPINISNQPILGSQLLFYQIAEYASLMIVVIKPCPCKLFLYAFWVNGCCYQL